MTFIAKISNVLTRRWGWSGRLLGFALGFGVLFAALAYDEIPYPLWVKKAAYNDAGPAGVVSGGVVTNLVGGVDYGDGSTAPASNKTVTYAISYGPGATSDPSTLGGLTFEDSMSASMHMVGSPQVPSSWTSTTNANATVSYTSPPLMAGSSSGRSPAAPAIMATGTGGGDGWVPIIYNSPDGKTKRFFEIYHHQYTGHINCQNYTDGSACPGYPKTLAYGASNTTLGTPMLQHTVIVGTKLYYPATNPDKSIGIGCWEASTDTNCGYIPLANHLANSATLSGTTSYGNFIGVMQLPSNPNRLYMAEWGYLYCWDLGTNASCGAPYRFLTSAGHFNPAKQAHVDLLVAGTKNAPAMFAFTNGYLSCMDFSSGTAAACVGTWPKFLGTVLDGNDRNALVHYLDATGNVVGACADFDAGWASFNATIACYDTKGTPKSTPQILIDNRPNYYLVSTSAVYGTRVYYALTTGWGGINGADGSKGATACWDFSTGAACAGFTDAGGGTAASAAKVGLRRWNYANKGSTSAGVIGQTVDYGYAFDGKCGFGLGDVANLWSFDPNTGSAPCNSASDDVTVPDPKAFCDGLDHLSNWDRVQFSNTPSAIASVTMTVYDAAACPSPKPTSTCTVLATGDPVASLLPNPTLWTIKLSPAVSLKAYPSIRVTYDYGFVNNTPPTSYPGFSVSTLYTPDATSGDTKGAIGQVCMRAQVNNCPASVIDNQAIIKRGDPSRPGYGNVLGRALSTMFTGMDNPSYSDTAPAVNNSASVSGRVIYRTTYQVTDWSGDLTAYSTDSSGNPSTALWTTGAAVAASAPVGAAQKLPSASLRNILTTTGAGTGTGLGFDATSLQGKLSPTNLAYFGSSPSDQNDLINYLRGDRSLEAKQGTSNPYRRRMLWDTTHSVTALGDFIHSAPVYDNKMVYAQANDGMLHAFNATSGVESFAFVPSAVFPLLKPLSAVSYVHNWIMDGQVAIAHAGTGTSATATLIGSTGGVKPALFGIDVSGLPATAPGPSQVLFETTHAALGRANGAIKLATLPSGTAVALLGNGMGSTGDQAQLIQVNIATGAITAINTNTGSASTPNGLSAPTSLVVNGQLVAVYAGDAQGNLWRFPVSSGGIGTPTKLFTTAPFQPISAAPTVTGKLLLNGKTGYYVYFGTGKTVDRTNTLYDPATTDEQALQTLYGVFDQASSSGVPNASTILSSSLVQQTMGADNKATNYKVDLGSMNGWYLNLAAGDPSQQRAAERILGRVVYNPSTNAVSVVTAIPQKSGCYNANLAGSHFINISATTGGPTSSSRIIDATPGVNQIMLVGSMGEITLVSAPGGANQNLTSNAGGETPLGGGPAGAPPRGDPGGNCTGITCGPGVPPSMTLKRTSWVHLY